MPWRIPTLVPHSASGNLGGCMMAKTLDELVQEEIARKAAMQSSQRAGLSAPPNEPWTCPNCGLTYQPEGEIAPRRRYYELLPSGLPGCERCARAAFTALIRDQLFRGAM